MENRYNRNILLEGVREKGQERLRNSRVLVIGAGGLGSPVLFYLAAAGIGTIGIVDYDCVDESNLQRQIIHSTSDIGKMKIDSAAEKLTALNPELNVVTYPDRFGRENAQDLVKSYDFVVDCCDNYATKFLINDICVEQRKAYSHGAVVAMRGEAMTYVPGGACYRCVFEKAPSGDKCPDSSDIGILGSMAGIIGSIQATEAVKYLTRQSGLLLNRILIADGKQMTFHSLKVNKRNRCICDLPW